MKTETKNKEAGMKKVYEVVQTKSGLSLGRYISTCEEGAIYAMLKDAKDDSEPDAGLKAYEMEPTAEEEAIIHG